jgi:hypothetical protein
MLAMLSASGRLDDQKAVVHELTTGLGLTLERIAPTSITISHRACKDINGKPQRVRLEGGIYRKDFDAKDFTSKAQSDYESTEVRRRLRDHSIHADTMAKKTEYHKEMYKDAVAPLPLDIAVQPVIMAQTPQKSTETLSVADTAPKRPIHRPR